MSNKTREILRRILLGIFAFSVCMMLWQWFDKSEGADAYEEARQMATQTESSAAAEATAVPEETLPEETRDKVRVGWMPAPIEDEDAHIAKLEQLDLTALQEVNEDVLGWIYLPNSKIDYPILQGEDNEYYLNRTWQKQFNFVGSIFLEYRNSPDFTDFNTIVYGHNMNDGSMFADVSRYVTDWFYQRNPYIYLVQPDGVFRYEVFSAYKAPVEGKTYGLSFNQLETRLEFLTYAVENSEIETDVVPQVSDRILTLSTCTGRGYKNRWVVHARLPMIPVEE